MYRKNTATQYIYFGLINATSGAALTGATVTAYRALDGNAQASATGTFTELGNGQYRFNLSQADTNANNGSYLFTATNAIPVEKTVVFTAADPTDATAFGISRLDAAITSRMATFTLPTNFSSLAITAGGAVTAGTVSDKTGYSLTQAFPSNFASMAITAGGAVTAGTVSDKTGYSLSQTFPSNFASMSIDANGKVLLQPTQTGVTIPMVTTVEELGQLALSANDAVNDIGPAVWNSLTSASWLSGSFGERVLASSTTQRTLLVTGSNHVAADIHELQSGVITAADFAAGAIDANALAADAATEVANAVAATQALSRLDSMIESDGAGQFRFDTIALENAPAGGGGGGTDWTSNERTAIRSILGFDSNGTVSLPTVGVMDAIKDKTDLITSDGISVLEDRVNESTITMQYNESTTASVNLDEDTTSATLQFVVSRPDGTDVLTIANGSITRTATSFTVTITTAVTATLGQYVWSLRDITGGTNRVVTKGVLTVQNAASV